MSKTNDESRNNEVHRPSSDFSQELAREPGGQDINKCIQCGICTASCMVASYDDKYRPRKIVQKILLGKRDEVLDSELPWLCMTCRLCEERCQEGVSLAEIFHAVREIGAREGRMPNVFRRTVDKVLKDGWLLKDSYSDFEEEEREDLGLDPDLGWNDEFVSKVKKKYFSEGDSEE